MAIPEIPNTQCPEWGNGAHTNRDMLGAILLASGGSAADIPNTQCPAWGNGKYTERDLLAAILLATDGGSGDVVGPASAVDGNMALFDGVTGKLIKDGGAPFNPAIPGPIGGTTPATGAFTRLTASANGAASAPALNVTGTVFTGGTSTTTKPLALIETTGATSNNWSTSGTMLGANAVSGFAGNLAAFQVAAVTKQILGSDGRVQAEVGGAFPQFCGIGYTTSGMRVAADRLDFWLANSVMMTVTTGSALDLSSIGVVAFSADTRVRRGAAATIQLGDNHATTPTAQTLQAHGVTTGTGASLTLKGGSGSVARGSVILNGGNRAANVVDASDLATAITLVNALKAAAISHGLMAP